MRFLANIFLVGVTALAQDRVAGLKSADLAFDSNNGYLPALLKALHVPVESQIAVFSKTSIQSLRIDAANPRLLYFNDSVTVGWVRGGFIEIASQDDARGMQFYTLHQRRDAQIVHREDCLNCHKSGSTLLRSVVASSDGIASAEIDIDSRTPFEKLWGGWFVTGKEVPRVHMGNTASPVESDVAALMVFAHQMRMMNLLAHPDNVTELVDRLLFIDEARLPGRIEGGPAFTKMFEASGPRDHKGRSLRQLDLEHRLMRYRCSYMIYSEAFDALPPTTKDAVYRRMWCVLLTRFSPSDRQAVIEILRDTKTGLPAYFW